MPGRVSEMRATLPERIADAQAVLSWYHGPQDHDHFAREVVPNWVGQLASASPFTVLGSLAQLAWHAGQVTVLRRYLHDAHLPHIVGAMLKVVDDPDQLLPVRRAAIRAAVMLAPQLVAERMAEILKIYREPKELRVAVAEAYVGERVPERIRQAVYNVIFDISGDRPEVIAAAMRLLPSFATSPVGLEKLVHWAFKTKNEAVYDAAALAVRQIIALTPDPEYVPENVGLMLDRIRYSIEMIPHETMAPHENRGLYVAERLGKIALPMLEELVAPGNRSHPQVVAAVTRVIGLIKADVAYSPDTARLIWDVGAVMEFSGIPERFRTASAVELVDMWQSGTVSLFDAQYIGQRLRELGPEGWAALSARLPSLSATSRQQLRQYIAAMATDAALALPHIAPHGMDHEMAAPAVKAWRAGVATLLTVPEAEGSIEVMRARAAAAAVAPRGGHMDAVVERVLRK